MMRLQLVPAGDLTDQERARWRALRAGNPQLDSPYFDPAFASAVLETGVEVVVAVDGRGPQLTTLLACQRDASVLRPVGWPGADFQGPVSAVGTTFDPRELLGEGIRSLEFDHWLLPSKGLERWTESLAASPFIDVSGGLEGYLSRASRTGKDNLGQARRRTAQAERDRGPVRFCARTIDEAALAWLIERKREQYAATGARDYLATSARRRLLSLLLHTEEPGCSGILSTLHFGDSLVAAHFGIRSEHVLHWWFPVYDPAVAGYAPGWILLRELAMAAPGLGLERIDLGRGDDEYKRRACTGQVQVAAGAVSGSEVGRVVRQVRRTAVSTAKASPVAPLLRRAVHAHRRSSTAR
jgi:CelD/BcsL family acetyltransferase involved in cellulose biosynthesis